MKPRIRDNIVTAKFTANQSTFRRSPTAVYERVMNHGLASLKQVAM